MCSRFGLEVELDTQCSSWESNSGPLEEQYMLLITESSFQLQKY